MLCYLLIADVINVRTCKIEFSAAIFYNSTVFAINPHSQSRTEINFLHFLPRQNPVLQGNIPGVNKPTNLITNLNCTNS